MIKIFFYQDLEDSVIISRKKIGKIIRVDKDSLLAQVKFDHSVDLHELADFFYSAENTLMIDMKHFEWNFLKSLWKPLKSTGDM